MAYDPAVIDAIDRVLDRYNASPKVRKAAYEGTIVETGGKNLRYGDRDSLGAFQQRPSQGWGTPSQILDPEYAATQFVTRAIEANKTGRYKSAGALAQAVQRSAFPDRYDAVGAQAESILASLGGGGGGSRSQSAPGPSGSSSSAAPQLLDAGQGSDFTSLLGSLLAKPQPAQPSTTPIQAPTFAAGPKLPQGAQLLQPTAAPAPQQQDKFSDALSLAGALRGSGPTLGPDQASEAPQTAPVQPTGDAPPGSSQGATVAALVGRADQIDAQRLPYRWGGGHGGKVNPAKAEPLDCSGAVSAVLGIDPRVSGQFTSWGKAGDGGDNGVTVYANDHHVLMKINGHFFGTSASNPGGGAGWIPRTAIGSGYLKNFTARHL